MTNDNEDTTSRRDYFGLIAERPQWFSNPDDGIAVATDRAEIDAIEAEMAGRYLAANQPAAWAEVGIRYEDPYLILLRDAVRFPDGSPGVHHRVLRRAGDVSGAAMMPVLDGQIVLVRHFRHATRNWHWEVPRGAIDAGETSLDAARRELAEEISASTRELVPLGQMHGATALMGMSVVLYLARLDSIGLTAVGEGISNTRLVSIAAFEAMVRANEITDSFTLGCFLHARLKGLV